MIDLLKPCLLHKESSDRCLYNALCTCMCVSSFHDDCVIACRNLWPNGFKMLCCIQRKKVACIFFTERLYFYSSGKISIERIFAM